MRLLSLIVLLLVVVPSNAAQWFIDSRATGSNAGTSWANAWTNFNAVVLSSLNPGDVVNISGGPIGSTNTYTGDLNFSLQSGNNATAASPITFQVAKDDPTHSGMVIQNGLCYVNRNGYVFDGSATTNIYTPTTWQLFTSSPGSGLYTNIHWMIGRTNNDGNHLFNFVSCQDQIFHDIWLYTNGTQQFAVGQDVNDLEFNGNSGGTKIKNCHAYNFVAGGSWGFGWEASGFQSNGWSQIILDHYIVEYVHDNYMQGDGNIWMHHFIHRKWAPPSVGHPDNIQGVSQWMIVDDFVCEDQPGSLYYVEANDTNGWQHARVYNGLFITTSQNWGNGIGVTGHDNDTSIALPINDIVFANITVDNPTGANVFWWNMGVNRTPCTCTNYNVWNVAILMHTNATTSAFAFPTNTVFENDTKGLTYDPNQVNINFNSVCRVDNKTTGVGTALGIQYGKNGDHFSQGYTNFALFSVDYPQYASNNNVFAGYISSANYDFRPGWDYALKGQGTNLLLTSLTNTMPYIGTDLLEAPRPLTGPVDIGAFQSDSRLKLWLTFHNWNGVTNVWDDSGNTNHAIPFSDPTNCPVVGIGQDGKIAAWFLGTNAWPGPPGETGGSIQYFGVTNLQGGITDITNGTIAYWAWSQTNSSRVSAIFDSGYPDIDGSWYIGRYFSSSTVFRLWTNDTIINANAWPDTITLDSNNFQTQVGSWNHYAVSWANIGATNHNITYFNGVPYFTNDTPNFPVLKIRQEPGNPVNWLGISVWKHQSGPTLDPLHQSPPNVGWWGGGMDDLRIYTSTLSPSEIAALAIGGGSGASAPVSDPAITIQPQPQSVQVGQTATFTVTATTSNPPLTYQWAKNGSTISGATLSTYTTPSTLITDNEALFTVGVTNSLSSGLLSSSALLTVTNPPFTTLYQKTLSGQWSGQP